MSRSWKRFYQILGSALLILAAVFPFFAVQDCIRCTRLQYVSIRVWKVLIGSAYIVRKTEQSAFILEQLAGNWADDTH